MAGVKKRTLRDGHKKALGLDQDDSVRATRQQPKPKIPDSNPLQDRYQRLAHLPDATVRRAWFTLAHLMVQPGSTILDLGCGGGKLTYAMAVLAPDMKFIGMDTDTRGIQSAIKTWDAPNLEFQNGPIDNPAAAGIGPVDAIINCFTLHEIYSSNAFHDRPVVQALENQFALLKPEGLMLIRDYAKPDPDGYVLMEMPDVRSTGEELHELSEADLLVWFSEHASPNGDPGCAGFFIEELPPRFPRTRLFRLPHKWAYEFIMRKDDLSSWESNLPKEFTFFTQREYRKALRSLGARVYYSAPHWNDEYVKNRFEGHFRLYGEDGKPLGPPPTSFIAVAQKVGERRSLRLQERRPSSKTGSSLRVQAMRNDNDGRLVDIVTRDINITEILPYRVTENGELNIFVHHGVPRGIVNAVPRMGQDLDGKKWSGHMTEAIAVETETVTHIGPDDVKGAALFARDMLGLKPMPNRVMEKGPAVYPAPDYIDERIDTLYLEVESSSATLEPKVINADIAGFLSRGKIVEISAQSILNGIAVGMIPNARMEIQILALYQRLGMKAESWSECPLILEEADVPITDVHDLMAKMTETDGRYRATRGSAGQLRPVQSIFVDEGQINGGVAGLAARDMDFIIADDQTENIAIVMPLLRSHSGEVLAGYTTEFLPVPQRYKGNGLTVTVPSIPLPRDIRNMDDARHYIADYMKVKPEHVARMGESFFLHMGLTPRRVYPFVMSGPFGQTKGQIHGTTNYSPLKDLWKLMYWDNSKSFAKIMSQSYKSLCHDSDMSPVFSFSKKMAESYGKSPMSAHATDMRGLGGGSSTSGDSNGGSDSAAGSGDTPSGALLQDQPQQNDTTQQKRMERREKARDQNEKKPIIK